MLRTGSTYIIPARFNEETVERVHLRWFPCLPNAKTLGIPTVFNSLVWTYPDEVQGDGLGEVVDAYRKHLKGINPGYTGQCEPIGDESWWTDGVPTAFMADGEGCCRSTIFGSGGVSANGSADEVGLISSGGIMADGSL